MMEEAQTTAREPTPFPIANAPPIMFGAHRDLVRWGVWILLVGALLYAANLAFNVFLSYVYAPSVSSNVPVYAHAVLWAAAGSLVGLGVFLAALGLSRRTPGGNARWVVGGLLMFVGFLAGASTQLLVDAYYFGGSPLGGDAIRTFGVISTGLGLLLPVGLLVFFLGFLPPEGVHRVA